MNAELETTRHKTFHRLKERSKLELWDLCVDEGLEVESYDNFRELFIKAMNESFRVGDDKTLNL